MWAISGMPTASATSSAMRSGTAPEVPDACRPTRTLMPTITSRLAFATSTASMGFIRRRSALSPTMTRFEKPKMPACDTCR